MVRSVQRVCDWTIVRRRIGTGQNRRGAIADRAELLILSANGFGQFCSTLSSHKTLSSIAQETIPPLHLQIEGKPPRRLHHNRPNQAIVKRLLLAAFIRSRHNAIHNGWSQTKQRHRVHL
jgi:hypothetical protein